jgi:hypothetical protein
MVRNGQVVKKGWASPGRRPGEGFPAFRGGIRRGKCGKTGKDASPHGVLPSEPMICDEPAPLFWQARSARSTLGVAQKQVVTVPRGLSPSAQVERRILSAVCRWRREKPNGLNNEPGPRPVNGYNNS